MPNAVAYSAISRARSGFRPAVKRPDRGDMPALARGRGIKVERTVTIARPAKGLYQVEELKQRTGGRGPDACIDAVGLEAHGTTLDAVYDRVKHAIRLAADRSHALREAIQACRKGGTVSIPGVYGGVLDKFPMGAVFAKGLTLKQGQTHVHRYMRRLLESIERGEIDPAFVVTHRLPLGAAPAAYRTFNAKDDGCIKVVLDPGA